MIIKPTGLINCLSVFKGLTQLSSKKLSAASAFSLAVYNCKLVIILLYLLKIRISNKDKQSVF